MSSRSSHASANISSATSPLALVTGGAGFIGSHIVAQLLKTGWRVRVLDNLSSGTLANLPDSNPNLSIIQGDIRDRDAAFAACDGVDTIFHLAALVSVSESSRAPEAAHEINVVGTSTVLACAENQNVRRVVFSSSCAVYGNSACDAQHEGLPPAPESPYAKGKLAGEDLLSARCSSRLSAVILRYFNVYGPRQRPDSAYAAAIPRFMQQARTGQPAVIFGDGGQTRDFVFVEDVARANLLAATVAVPDQRPLICNVGTGRAISILELWSTIAGLSASPLEYQLAPARAEEVRHSRACTKHASKALGFTARTSLRHGLQTLRESFSS